MKSKKTEIIEKAEKAAEKALEEQRKAAKRKKNIKKVIIYTLILLLVVGCLYCYNFKLKNERWPWVKEAVASPMDSMIQTKVYESTYTTEIDVSGYVQAYQTQDVMIRASGSVSGVYVQEGDRVKKGDLLATIDSTQAEYNVAQVEWQLEKAKINGTSSAKDLELMELNLKNAKQQLENTKAYANFDGVVVSVSIAEGDYFSAGSSVMTIIDDSKLKATVEVDEIDILMISKGMKATLTSDSSSGTVIEGRVSYIPMVGRYSNQGIGVMDVELVIDNPPSTLKPGFSFEGTINVESEQKMLLVSQSAVKTTRGSSTVTKLLEDGTTQTVSVVVKYLGENLYQIVSGDIKDGDTVVYSRSGDTSGMSGIMSLMGGATMPSGDFGGGMPSGGFGGGSMPSGGFGGGSRGGF